MPKRIPSLSFNRFLAAGDIVASLPPEDRIELNFGVFLKQNDIELIFLKFL